MSKITEVIVYLQGAQITRSEKFKVQKGLNRVVFDSLSPEINIESITVFSDENSVVLSVTHNNIYIQENNSGRVAESMERIKTLQNELDIVNAMMNVCKEEEEMLRQKCIMSSEGKICRTDELKGTIEFFRNRMSQLCKEKIETQNNIDEIKNEISMIKTEIGNLSASMHKSRVVLEICCERDCETELTLSYFISGASWKPYYDIRAVDVESPVTIQFKGMVFQNTGEDWENVNLVLSTGNPSLSGDLPELKPWYLKLNAYPAYRSKEMYQSFNAVASEISSDCMEELEESKYERTVEPRSIDTFFSESMTSTEYTLAIPYTILSSDSGKSVDIKSHSLSAEYIYHCVRKLEKDVFLMAYIKEWEHLNLLGGNASIFFEGKYVGSSYIDPRKADENIKISMGRDKGITVTRVKGKDFSGKTFTGANIRASREWVLMAKNLKKQSIDIILEDQIPVSADKGITVDAVNISDADMDKDTGRLVWKFKLEPAESRSVAVKYTVTYPASSTLILE